MNDRSRHVDMVPPHRTDTSLPVPSRLTTRRRLSPDGLLTGRHAPSCSQAFLAALLAWPASAWANSMSVIGQGPLIFIGPAVGLLTALVIGWPARRASRPDRPVSDIAALLAVLALPAHGWLGFLTEVGGRFYLGSRIDSLPQAVLVVVLAVVPVIGVGWSAGMCTRVLVRWLGDRRSRG